MGWDRSARVSDPCLHPVGAGARADLRCLDPPEALIAGHGAIRWILLRQAGHTAVVISHGTVRYWDDDEGFGVLDSADTQAAAGRTSRWSSWTGSGAWQRVT